MKLEHFGMAEPGDCRLVFAADAEELAQAIEAERAAHPADKQPEEDELVTAAINRAILEGFSPLYAQLVQDYGLVPLTDPDFELLAVNREEGFRAGAQFFSLPPLELGRYTGFVQPIQPRPIRQLTIELEINRHHGDEERAADTEGKRALRQQVTQELYAQRCAQAEQLAKRELVFQLGAEVRGALPKQLVANNYFSEQRHFSLSLQARGVNFDQYLAVRKQTVEEFRAELHAQAQQRLRGRLGLLLVADREHLWPTAEQTASALAAWDPKREGERTFPANDERKVRQRIASDRAVEYIVAHSTLTPPPAQPVVLMVDAGQSAK